jgi:RNA polymerase sigma factor (sigma-70 family)
MHRRAGDQSVAIDTCRSEPQFVGLLKRIAERQVWDRARQVVRRRRQAHVQPDAEGALEQRADPGKTPSSHAWRKERARIVERVMEAVLSPIEREIVRMRFLEQRSVADTAAALDKTEGAVKMATQRLLEKLRQQLSSSLAGSFSS